MYRLTAADSFAGVFVAIYDAQTRELMKQLDKFFDSYLEVPRIQVGKRQNIETLINEEALLLAQYLRNEKSEWTPRTVMVQLILRAQHIIQDNSQCS